MRRMLVSRSALEKVRPADRLRRTTSPSRLVTAAAALLEQQVHQGAGEGRLAAAGQAGEEQHEALLLRLGLVAVDDRGDGVGVARRRRSALAPGRAPGRGRRSSPRPARRARGRRRRRRGRERVRRRRRRRRAGRPRRGWPAPARRGRARGAGAHQRDEHHAAEAAQLVEVGLGERVDDGHEGGAGVLLADLGRGEVQPAEGAVLRVGQRLAATRRPRPGPAAGPRGRPARPRSLAVGQVRA